MDTTKLAIALMAQVKEYVQPALDAMAKAFDERERELLARVDAIVATLPEHAKDAALDALSTMPVPVNGKDADPALIAEQVMAAVAALPKPQDGKSVSPEDLRPMLADEVAKAVAEIPKPADGKDAPPISSEQISKAVEDYCTANPPAPGRDGEKGSDAVVTPEIVALALEQVQPMIDAAVKALPAPLPGKDAEPVDMTVVAELVKREVQALPKAVDGKSITLDDVRPMVQEFLATIPVPKDGASVSIEDMASRIESVVESKQASWELQFERRAQDRLQSALDRIPAPKDGKDGANGRDALDLSDFEVEAKDSGRVLVMRLKRGETVIEREVVTGVVLDRGVYKADTEYSKGDFTTWGGSGWIAQRDTKAKPETDDSWRLAVKRGHNGKDGKDFMPPSAPATVKLT